MPDRLKSITIIFEYADGEGAPIIKREYKSVHPEGHGAPVEIEITAEERLALYGTAHAANAGLIADANAARDQLQADLDATRNELQIVRAERDALRAGA